MSPVLRQNSLPFVERKRGVNRSKSLVRDKVTSKNDEEPRNYLSEIENILSPSKKRALTINNEDELSSPSKRICSPKQSPSRIRTPSSALAKLCIESPQGGNSTKPRLAPKELFPTTGLQQARKAFYCSAPVQLPGREMQLEKLKKFILNHLKEQTSGSLYISGPPGTGKSACVNSMLQDPEISKKFQIVYVNCTSIQSSKTVYSRIVQDLHINVKGKTEKQYLTAINKYLRNKHKIILMVLDEIDQLATRTQSVLYSIFEWPSVEDSKIVLIGIANAMDLTDRILPRLCLKVELKPELMHFSPYSKEEIVSILQHRLCEVGVSHDSAVGALNLIAGKIAASSGDIRKALDLSRRVIEVTSDKSTPVDDNEPEKAINKKQLENEKEPVLGQSPRKLPPIEYSPRKSPRKFSIDSPKKLLVLESLEQSPRKSPRKLNLSIDPKDVISVVKNVYGSSKTFNNEDNCYPLHQKLLICTMLLIMKKGKNKYLNIGQFHLVYHKVCTKRGITGVDLSSFIYLCRQVEMTGAVHIGKGNGKLAKINLQWDENEISNTLRDQQLLSSVLGDTSCL